MKVIWSSRAQRRLRQIYTYIAEDQPEHAKRMVNRLTKRSQQLRTQPRLGRVVPEYAREDIRELIEGSYRILYQLKTERIDVLTVIGGSQMLPDTAESLES